MTGHRTTWRHAITQVMERQDDSWQEVVACTLTDAELDEEFDAGYGNVEGKPFGLWTVRHVYFPVVYDGAEFVASVPRDPAGPIRHLGVTDVRYGLA